MVEGILLGLSLPSIFIGIVVWHIWLDTPDDKFIEKHKSADDNRGMFD